MVMTSNDPVRTGGSTNMPVHQFTALKTPVRVGRATREAPALWSGTLLFRKNTPIPGEGSFALASEIEARVAATTKGFVVQSGWAAIKASGPTLAEASSNFLTAICHTYLALQDMKTKNHRLSARDRAAFETLEGLLGPQGS